MISYGGIDLHLSSAEDAANIASLIPIQDAFQFPRPRWHGDAQLDPRPLFNWILSRRIKLNSYFNPWGASRWGYALVLANGKMRAKIAKLNSAGQPLAFKMDDDLGGSMSTYLYQLPAVPLTKVATSPQLPLHVLPLVDERYQWWERAAQIEVVEGVTSWTDLYAQIATALGVTIAVDPVPAPYMMPGAALGRSYQPLPLLLDLVASSVGQRIVRRLDGSFAAINPATARALQIAQANANRKYAGGSLELGVLDA